MLLRGGISVDAFTEHVSKDIVQMLQAIIILFVAAEAMFRGPFSRFGWLRGSVEARMSEICAPISRSLCLDDPAGDAAACWRRSAGCSPSARA